MQELRLVGVNDDGSRVVLVSQEGTRYTTPIDERLEAAARRDRARLGQLEIEMGDGSAPARHPGPHSVRGDRGGGGNHRGNHHGAGTTVRRSGPRGAGVHGARGASCGRPSTGGRWMHRPASTTS